MKLLNKTCPPPKCVFVLICQFRLGLLSNATPVPGGKMTGGWVAEEWNWKIRTIVKVDHAQRAQSETSFLKLL